MNTKSKKIEKDTEARILAAARKIFILKGMDGARMQEIANEAGINKALLHYYFRSKSQLFMMIFRDELASFFPSLIPALLSQDTTFDQKVRHFVEAYIDIFLKNPFLPIFVIREMNRNPEVVAQFFSEAGIDTGSFGQIIEGIAQGLDIDPGEARHLMVSTVSACIFPFAGRPMIEHLIFSDSPGDFDRFLEERKKYVADLLVCSVRGRTTNNEQL